jgi:hypothetical protein
MPSPRQMEKLAAANGLGENDPSTRPLGPTDDLPPEYWQALLDDPRADAGPSGSSVGALRLAEMPRHLLRVACRRCGRIVEIQTADACRLYGRQAVWKQVGQRLLDDTCRQRTGRHEEDGCWPKFE